MTKPPKILIISDTHGLVLPIKEIMANHPDVDAVMNFDPILKNVHVVRGNCDYDRTLPNDLTIDIGNHKIYVTHGHMYGVKGSLEHLHNRAKEVGADVALYGHTHVAQADTMDDILLVNPGSIAYPRKRKEKTYALLTLNDDKNHHVEFHIF